jgi:hypothetical protein
MYAALDGACFGASPFFRSFCPPRSVPATAECTGNVANACMPDERSADNVQNPMLSECFGHACDVAVHDAGDVPDEGSADNMQNLMLKSACFGYACAVAVHDAGIMPGERPAIALVGVEFNAQYVGGHIGVSAGAEMTMLLMTAMVDHCRVILPVMAKGTPQPRYKMMVQSHDFGATGGACDVPGALCSSEQGCKV